MSLGFVRVAFTNPFLPNPFFPMSGWADPEFEKDCCCWCKAYNSLLRNLFLFNVPRKFRSWLY